MVKKSVIVGMGFDAVLLILSVIVAPFIVAFTSITFTYLLLKDKPWRKSHKEQLPCSM